MRYMLLIYTDENLAPSMTEEDATAVMNAYYAYGNAMREAGAHLAGEALNYASQAKTVRVRNGKTLVTDGPYAETKEQLGGFYMVNAQNLDEAIVWATRCPGIQFAPLEIRPIVEHN